MSGAWLSAEVRGQVEQRAAGWCEYCQVPDGAGLWRHEADHIIAAQHGGKTELSNLALACFQCNRRKGPNVAAVDPETGRIVALFNPRLQPWTDHFRSEGPQILPLSETGRATAAALGFNAPERLVVRRALRESGRWPA